MAQTKRRPRSETSHEDRDRLTSSAVADPHATAFAERQRDPARYDNPTIATPGVLEDIDEDEVEGVPGRVGLIDADAPSDLDPSVDNRDQVQPMLDTIADATEDDPALATAVINAHESDAVDVQAMMEEQQQRREEARAALAQSREANRAVAEGSSKTTKAAATTSTSSTSTTTK